MSCDQTCVLCLQAQVLPSMVPAVAHLRDQREAGIGGSSSAGAPSAAGVSGDPLRAALPDMRLGPRALTCNHFMHYQCYLNYSCAPILFPHILLHFPASGISSSLAERPQCAVKISATSRCCCRHLCSNRRALRAEGSRLPSAPRPALL